MHRWTDEDNLIAYCLYRLGRDAFNLPFEDIADVLGMGTNSLGLKIANFKAIDGLGGLEQYSTQAERIHRRYSQFSDSELLAAGSSALDEAIQRGGPRPQDVSQDQLQRQLEKAQALVQRLEQQLAKHNRRPNI